MTSLDSPATSEVRARVRTSVDRQVDGVVRVAVAGEVDMATAPGLRAALEEALAVHAPTRLEVSLAEVTFCDSSGVNCLVGVRRLADQMGCRLVVTDPRASVWQVLHVTAVLEYLGVPDRSR